MGQRYINLFRIDYFIIGRQNHPQLISRTLDRCKIALIVETDPAGGFTTDTGTWSEIANRGKELLDLCLWAKRQKHGYTFMGGAASAGANRKLNIIAFAKDSVFDRALVGDLSGGAVDGKGPLILLNTSGWAGNLSQA